MLTGLYLKVGAQSGGYSYHFCTVRWFNLIRYNAPYFFPFKNGKVFIALQKFSSK